MTFFLLELVNFRFSDIILNTHVKMTFVLLELVNFRFSDLILNSHIKWMTYYLTNRITHIYFFEITYEL